MDCVTVYVLPVQGWFWALYVVWASFMGGAEAYTGGVRGQGCRASKGML
jgi:hypothetical protein